MDLDKLARVVRNAIDFIEESFNGEERSHVLMCLGIFLGAMEEEWPEVSYEKIQAMLRTPKQGSN